jgi:hypothetical protein
MAKILFLDKSYIEVKQSGDEYDKILIIISARDGFQTNKKITNCVEITREQWCQLVNFEAK